MKCIHRYCVSPKGYVWVWKPYLRTLELENEVSAYDWGYVANMVVKDFTNSTIEEFDRLTHMTSSRDQVTRIDGRMKLHRFVEEHGKEMCDKMWKIIK